MIQRASIEAELPAAARRGELVAYFQPQVDVASGRIVAAEALCRWNHPQLGAVPPSEFIPIAEETGVIHEIGDFMLEQSCEFARAVDGDGIEVAVNVSAVQLGHPDFSTRAVERYRRHGLDPARFTFELTESQPVADIPDAVVQLEQLRGLGSGISIDDFGIGHSSLKQLDALPFTELKVDQSLIREDTDETWDRVASLVAIVRHRGMRIVAEGVETREQDERIREVGCDRAQGYFLGMPMPVAEFVAFLKTHQRTPLPRLARPAARALASLGLRNLEDLSTRTRVEIGALRGIGPKTIASLMSALAAAKLAFAA